MNNSWFNFIVNNLENLVTSTELGNSGVGVFIASWYFNGAETKTTYVVSYSKLVYYYLDWRLSLELVQYEPNAYHTLLYNIAYEFCVNTIDSFANAWLVNNEYFTYLFTNDANPFYSSENLETTETHSENANKSGSGSDNENFSAQETKSETYKKSGNNSDTTTTNNSELTLNSDSTLNTLTPTTVGSVTKQIWGENNGNSLGSANSLSNININTLQSNNKGTTGLDNKQSNFSETDNNSANNSNAHTNAKTYKNSETNDVSGKNTRNETRKSINMIELYNNSNFKLMFKEWDEVYERIMQKYRVNIIVPFTVKKGWFF